MATTVHDVVIVGGRCAGAATARLLAGCGLDVLVLERAAMPSDIHSTHGFARGAVVQLDRWGLLDDVLASGAPAVREVRFGYLGAEQTRPIKERAGVDLLVAPRRHVLDQVLLDAAVRAGARVRTRTRVVGLLRDPSARVTGVRALDARGTEAHHLARLVVGADGIRSTVAAHVEAPVTAWFETATALYHAYVAGDSWPAFEFHVAESSYAGVFPTHDGRGCVWMARPADLLHRLRCGRTRTTELVDALHVAAPSLAERVGRGRIDGPVRGYQAARSFVRRAAGEGWALVGDAGYHRDPLTGHGITDAFRDAELLAGAIVAICSGDVDEGSALAAYGRARDGALATTFELTRLLADFPDPRRFVELQKELSDALEREAIDLAAHPAPGGRRAASAVSRSSTRQRDHVLLTTNT